MRSQSSEVPRTVRAFTLQESTILQEHTVDGFLPYPPAVILEFEFFALAFSPEQPEEVEFYTTLHALQVAYSIDGGTFDGLYLEDEESAAYWRELEQAPELADMIESAVNCTPGKEGQTVEVYRG